MDSNVLTGDTVDTGVRGQCHPMMQISIDGVNRMQHESQFRGVRGDFRFLNQFFNPSAIFDGVVVEKN